MEDFLKYTIKEYKYWTVSVSKNQNYLGRCIVWCKRDDALDLADATEEEQKELFVILNKLRSAVQNSFQADWMNYAFLGNETRHLHGHFVPRYTETKEFEGIIFKDDLYGQHYKTDRDFSVPAEVVEKIRLKIAKELE